VSISPFDDALSSGLPDFMEKGYVSLFCQAWVYFCPLLAGEAKSNKQSPPFFFSLESWAGPPFFSLGKLGNPLRVLDDTLPLRAMPYLFFVWKPKSWPFFLLLPRNRSANVITPSDKSSPFFKDGFLVVMKFSTHSFFRHIRLRLSRHSLPPFFSPGNSGHPFFFSLPYDKGLPRPFFSTQRQDVLTVLFS